MRNAWLYAGLLLAGFPLTSSTALAQDTGATDPEAAPVEAAPAEETAEVEATDVAQETAPADEAAPTEETAQPTLPPSEEAGLPTAPPDMPSVDELNVMMNGEDEAATTTVDTFEQYATNNPAGGTTTTTTAPTWTQISEAELLAPEETYPYVDWHGYYRFRTDNFWNLDLDTAGTSPVLPPIESVVNGDESRIGGIPDTTGAGESLADYYNDDAERLSSANMRFRLNPIFQVSENLRIHMEMNILDNIVLGSTPDGFNEEDGSSRTDMPLIGFTGSQEPPTWANSGRNSISVTQAYAEANTFAGTLRLGRMASHWGLGILANSGGSYSPLREQRVSRPSPALSGHSCLDCDFGDYVDRAMFITNLFDTYVALAWDFNSSGPTTMSTADSFGQPMDMGRYDNVTSYIVSVFRRPMRPQEIADRNRTLKELRRPALDWGAYFVYRTQRLSAEYYDPTENIVAEAEEFSPRGARAMIPDLWLRWQSEPAFRRHLRLELEAVAILGSIDNVTTGAAPDELNSRDIQQFAAALEFDYVNMAMATGFNGGFATGRTPANDDAAMGFGVLDQNIPVADEDVITAFRFDRNYMIDMIMFREIIGTVTNALYFAPYFQYDLFAKQDDVIGLRLDLVTAQAMNPETTPSGDAWYGVEADASLYYREPRYGADVSFGFYMPGSAFDGVGGRQRLNTPREYEDQGLLPQYDCAAGETCVEATPATTLQGHFYWAF